MSCQFIYTILVFWPCTERAKVSMRIFDFDVVQHYVIHFSFRGVVSLKRTFT